MQVKCERTPCTSCPYRKDVPSGVWSEEEYEKLRPYDEETSLQPLGMFGCHLKDVNREPDEDEFWLCTGWLVCHGRMCRGRDLLALRFQRSIDDETLDLPGDYDGPELHASGNEAADFGLSQVEHPDGKAIELARRLKKSHPHLKDNDDD